MKYILLIISIINILLFGCMKSQIKDSLTTTSHFHKDMTITILSNNPEDEKFARCLQTEMKEDLPELKIISEDKFRNNLFPWFEPGIAPKDAKGLSALLSKTMVRKHLDSLGVKILVYVHGETVQGELGGPGFCGGGYGGAGCLGYVSAERETNITTTVWNLEEVVSMGTTDIHYQGSIRVPMFIIPLPIPVFTESTACSETAKRISDCIKNKDSLQDKN